MICFRLCESTATHFQSNLRYRKGFIFCNTGNALMKKRYNLTAIGIGSDVNIYFSNDRTACALS